MTNSFIHEDLARNWHPLTPLDRQYAGEVLALQGAQGDYLICADDRRVIDGISSWWCKLLGHQHPVLRQALIDQAHSLEHAIFANTTCAPLVKLSGMLCERIANTHRVLYACDGSSAVEMALKLSLFVHAHTGQGQRRRFMHLANAYHGETVGAMSVSDVGKYTDGFDALCFSSDCLGPIPYTHTRQDPLWDNAEAAFAHLLPQLEEKAPHLAGIIVEPLVQGASGMRVYSADFLQRLGAWAQAKGIHIIADEIMTGMGRLGHWTASSMASLTPDLTIVSKSLTAGWLPLSAVLCSQAISEVGLEKTAQPFCHSHTYMGHPLAAAVAVATIELIEREDILARVRDLEGKLRERFTRMAQQTGLVHEVRALGAIVAGEITPEFPQENLARLSGWMLREGLLLRPLDRSLYWMPSALIEDETLARMEDITAEALNHHR